MHFSVNASLFAWSHNKITITFCKMINPKASCELMLLVLLLPFVMAMKLFHVASPAISTTAHLTSGCGPQWICHLHSLCVLASLFDVLLQKEANNEQAWGWSIEPIEKVVRTLVSSPWYTDLCPNGAKNHLQMAHLLLKADGLPQLAEKHELKQSLVHYEWKELEDP